MGSSEIGVETEMDSRKKLNMDSISSPAIGDLVTIKYAGVEVRKKIVGFTLDGGLVLEDVSENDSSLSG